MSQEHGALLREVIARHYARSKGAGSQALQEQPIAREEERQTRSEEVPIVGGLPEVPGILVAMCLSPVSGCICEASLTSYW